MNKRILFLLSFFTLFACTDDEGEAPAIDDGFDYAPLAVGQSSIFQIDSIIYDDFNSSSDTISFQRKEEIVNSFIDDAGVEAFRIELSRRANDTSAWQLIRVFTSRKNNTRYVRTDNNIATILLVFPPEKGTEWDGNLLNTKEESEFTYTSVDQTETINQQEYQPVVTVLQEDEFNRIQQFFTEEKYAKGVGLVYRKDKQLETELNGDIRNGYDATIRLMEFNP